MRTIILFFLSTIVTLEAVAQKSKTDRKEEKRQRISALAKQEEEGVIAYKKHTIFGIKLINDGYGAFLEIGRAKSVKKSLLFQLDISERKHNKENKELNPFLQQGPSLIFGKVNFFYPIKLGVQQQFLVGNKSNKSGVNVTANFGGGLSLAMLRPYLLEIDDTVTGVRKKVSYNSPDSAVFTSADAIGNLRAVGPTLGSGWGKSTFNPGIYAKASLRFDAGRYNEVVNGVEVGVTAEYYSKKVQQLAYVKAKSLFLNAYVAIIFGKRK